MRQKLRRNKRINNAFFAPKRRPLKLYKLGTKGTNKVIKIQMKDNVDAIRRCITASFFANAAKLHYTGVYKTVRDEHVLHIHPTSVLFPEQPPEWVVFNEVVQTSKDFMRDITVIKPEWLCELAPHFYQFGTERELASKKLKTAASSDSD